MRALAMWQKVTRREVCQQLIRVTVDIKIIDNAEADDGETYCKTVIEINKIDTKNAICFSLPFELLVTLQLQFTISIGQCEVLFSMHLLKYEK